MRINEENYIKELQRGRENALNFVVDKHLPLVKGVTLKVLGIFKDDGLIEECINDIFLSIWKNAKSFNGDRSNFKSWVCKVAKMKAIDYYRKRSKNKNEFKEIIEIEDKISIEDRVINIENKKELLKIINTLEQLDKEIFIMKYFLGMKSLEIGDKKNISESAVNNRLFKSKKRLKENLKTLEVY